MTPRQKMPPGQWRLLAAALTGWAATAATLPHPGTARWVAAASAVGGLICLAVACRRGRAALPLALGGLALAALTLLGARTEALEQRRADPAVVQAVETGGAREYEARLTGYPSVTGTALGPRHWARAEVRALGGGTGESGRGGVPSARGALSVPVLLWLPEEPPGHWAPGTPVTVTGVLQGMPPASDAAAGVRVRAIAEAPASGLGDRAGGFIGASAAGLRVQLRSAAATTPGAELVPGFAVGDTALVSTDLEADMLESSLTHLVAVSGANCALVTGAVVAVASRLGAGRRTRAVLAGTALAGFVVIVGPDASVQRAAVMASVLLLSDFGGRRAASLPALGAAIILLLLLNPWQALHPGFALSVAATAGILLLAPALERALRRVPLMPRVLSLPVSVALAAQIACGPFLLLLQSGIPAVGVLANVLAAPAAPIGTGVGLLAALLLPLSSTLGETAIVVAAFPARWVAATAEVTAALPFARWHWPEGWGGALLLAAVEAAALLAWAIASGRLAVPGGRRIEPRRPWNRRERRPRRVRLVIAVLGCAAGGTLLAVTVAMPVAEFAGTPRGWSIVACDVGQGDAFLVRDPARIEEVMVVDTGDDPSALTSCLDRFGVRRISLLVLTHDDRDHVGALPAIEEMVEAALVAPANREDGDDRPVLRRLERAGIPFTIGAAGMSNRTASGPRAAGSAPGGREPEREPEPEPDGLSWRILAPAVGEVPANPNAASLVMHVRAGESAVLMLADTGRDEHLRLLRDPGELDATIVKVAHHGSGDQDPRVLEAAGADYGLISVGEENTYGHPHPDVLADLDRVGTRALRTDLHGSIAITSDAGEVRVWVERGGE